jgi:hypothetical protein
VDSQAEQRTLIPQLGKMNVENPSIYLNFNLYAKPSTKLIPCSSNVEKSGQRTGACSGICLGDPRVAAGSKIGNLKFTTRL